MRKRKGLMPEFGCASVSSLVAGMGLHQQSIFDKSNEYTYIDIDIRIIM